jgi:hypothetical protein
MPPTQVLTAVHDYPRQGLTDASMWGCMPGSLRADRHISSTTCAGVSWHERFGCLPDDALPIDACPPPDCILVGMRVLLTGGTGFVGSHAVAAIAQAVRDVRLLVRRPKQVSASLGPLGVDVPDIVVATFSTKAGCQAPSRVAMRWCTRQGSSRWTRVVPRT